VAVLVSGGLDSAVLTWACGRDGSEVQPVYVRTGMKWEDVEFGWLQRFLKEVAWPGLRPLKELAFPLGDIYGSHWSVGGAGRPEFDAANEADFLPGRNVILISKTAVFC